MEPGEIGEIVAKGENIMLGYLQDPDATRRVLRNGWLHTGDLATVEADGRILLYGRGSVSINSGGEKVFPEEVESVLKEYPDVLDAVVVGLEDQRFGEQVVAVCQTRTTAIGAVALNEPVAGSGTSVEATGTSS